jgi:hypothetical protein
VNACAGAATGREATKDAPPSGVFFNRKNNVGIAGG